MQIVRNVKPKPPPRRGLLGLVGPPPGPAESVRLSEDARRNAEQIGDLTRLQKAEQRLGEQRLDWLEHCRRQQEHQESLLKRLREAQEAWLETFRQARIEHQRAVERVNAMWSDYFRG
ncbi:hypothetical protein DYH09_03235 [bacterium CPR1]|nr:hypothetical protein [bacterium CPR1]